MAVMVVVMEGDTPLSVQEVVAFSVQKLVLVKACCSSEYQAAYLLEC